MQETQETVQSGKLGETVTIPERTQSLEENAFMDCSSLRNVTSGKNCRKSESLPLQDVRSFLVLKFQIL